MSTQSATASSTPAAAGALLTPAEIAKRLKVRVSYLNRLRRRHGLPHVKVGKEIRFDLTAVRGWLEARAKSQGGKPETDAGALRARLEARMSAARAGQSAALRRHVLALALYRGTDDDPLEEAFKEVRDPAGQGVLLAIFSAARHLSEAAYYREHSALADADATAEAAEAQIREAYENRDRCLDNMIAGLLRDVPEYIEDPLAKVARGDLGWAGLAVEGLASMVITVTAIRELFGDGPNQGTPDTGTGAGGTGRAV